MNIRRRCACIPRAYRSEDDTAIRPKSQMCLAIDSRSLYLDMEKKQAAGHAEAGTRQCLYVIRHGERLDNVDYEWERTAERPYDPPLTDTGVEEAATAARERFHGKVNLRAKYYDRNISRVCHQECVITLRGQRCVYLVSCDRLSSGTGLEWSSCCPARETIVLGELLISLLSTFYRISSTLCHHLFSAAYKLLGKSAVY